MSSIPPLLPQTNSLPFAGAVIQELNMSTVEKNSHPPDNEMSSSTTDQAGLQQQASDSQSLLKTLPIELRDKIYGYLLLDANVTTVVGGTVSIWFETPTYLKAQYSMNLLQINKNLGAEAAKMFYEQNVFVVVLCTPVVGHDVLKQFAAVFPIAIRKKSDAQSFEKFSLKIKLRFVNENNNPRGRLGRIAQAVCKQPSHPPLKDDEDLGKVAMFAGNHLQFFLKLLHCKESRRRYYNLELEFGKELSERARTVLISGMKGIAAMQSRVVSIKGDALVGEEKKAIMPGASDSGQKSDTSASELHSILSGVESALNAGDKVTATGKLNLALFLNKLYTGENKQQILADIYFKQSTLALEMGLIDEALSLAETRYEKENRSQRSRLLLCRAHVAKLEAGGIRFYDAREVLLDTLTALPGNVEIQSLLDRTRTLQQSIHMANVAAMKLKNPKVFSKN